MKYFYTLLFAFLLSPALLATVDYDVRVEGNDVIISILSDQSYDHPANTFITGEFTIAWDKLYGEDIIESIEVLSDIPFDFDPSGHEMSQLDNETYFQKFGFANPVELDLIEGQSLDVLRINMINDNNQASGVLANNVSIDKNPPIRGGKASFINVFAEQWNDLADIESGAVGINDRLDFSIGVFPNPAVNSLMVQLDETLETATLVVTDINGRELISRPAQTGIELDVSELPVGTYYLQVRSDNALISGQKFVKID